MSLIDDFDIDDTYMFMYDYNEYISRKSELEQKISELSDKLEQKKTLKSELESELKNITDIHLLKIELVSKHMELKLELVKIKNSICSTESAIDKINQFIDRNSTRPQIIANSLIQQAKLKHELYEYGVKLTEMTEIFDNHSNQIDAFNLKYNSIIEPIDLVVLIESIKSIELVQLNKMMESEISKRTIKINQITVEINKLEIVSIPNLKSKLFDTQTFILYGNHTEFEMKFLEKYASSIDVDIDYAKCDDSNYCQDLIKTHLFFKYNLLEPTHNSEYETIYDDIYRWIVEITGSIDDKKYTMHVIVETKNLCPNIRNCYGKKCRRYMDRNMDYYCESCHGCIEDDISFDFDTIFNETTLMRTEPLYDSDEDDEEIFVSDISINKLKRINDLTYNNFIICYFEIQ